MLEAAVLTTAMSSMSIAVARHTMAIGRRLVRGGDMDGEEERDMDGSFGR